jgi:hypothetical protein
VTFLKICLCSSVAEPHHFYAAPAPNTNFDAALVAPVPTLLYNKPNFKNKPKLAKGLRLLFDSASLESTQHIINASYNQRLFTLLELTTKYEVNTCVALPNADTRTFHNVITSVAYPKKYFSDSDLNFFGFGYQYGYFTSGEGNRNFLKYRQSVFLEDVVS